MPDINECRAEGLRLAVELHSRQDFSLGFYSGDTAGRILGDAAQFALWLESRPARIKVGNPVITEQGHPARRFPLNRTGADMAVTIKDSQIATYPAPEAEDSKGFPVSDTITVSEDSAGAVVALVSNPDGTAVCTAVAPGAAQVTWTDGTISFSDTINVTAGDAATIVVGEPTITDQAPPSA
jgi:hypothetical protein